MDQYKSLLTSKTVWGVIFMILGALFKWSPEVVEAASTTATDIASAILQAVGAVLTIYGRIKADKQIKGVL